MSTAWLFLVWTGVAAGATHVAAGVDHLAALLPLSIGHRFRAFSVGVRWGIGHSAGVILIGVLGLTLRSSLDLDAIGGGTERLVGVMLIALGALGIRRSLGLRIHGHTHEHDGERHAHLHAHTGPDRAPRRHERDSGLHRHRHTAFFAGTLHGVAGSAHVLGVLPALALPGWAASGCYLASFAAGTILAMGGFALALGTATSGASPASLRRTLVGASSLTVLVGLAWLALPMLGLGSSG